jgi:hypothetical protein
VGHFALACGVRLGLGPTSTYLLTVRGQPGNGRLGTAVRILDDGGQRWLVAAEFVPPWVLPVTVAGQATLTRGWRSETVSAKRVAGADVGHVLKRYAQLVPEDRHYFDASPEDSEQAFARESYRHSVFRLGPPASD